MRGNSLISVSLLTVVAVWRNDDRTAQRGGITVTWPSIIPSSRVNSRPVVWPYGVPNIQSLGRGVAAMCGGVSAWRGVCRGQPWQQACLPNSGDIRRRRGDLRQTCPAWLFIRRVVAVRD